MEEIFMKRAVELASQGIGFTSPNPCVGAVIVKGGQIVAEGWHHKAGEDHAEIVAIKEMMRKSGIVTVDLEPTLFQNAVLYVTLEPCSHVGKTLPCVRAIVAAGFSKVVVGMKDPFKKVNGRGIKFLKKNGIKVELCRVGSRLFDEIRSINQPFIKWVKTGMPYVTLKSGMSLDGKIATSTGDSKWITGDVARADARLERSLCDAVIVGSGTVVADNPELACLEKFKNKRFLRVIIDKNLKLKTDLKVFRDKNVFVACSDTVTKKDKQRFVDDGIKVKSFGKSKVSIKKLLKYLGSLEIQSVFVEGGSGINGAFFDEEMIDRVVFYLAPMLIAGKNAVSVIAGDGAAKLTDSMALLNLRTSTLGADIKIEGFVRVY